VQQTDITAKANTPDNIETAQTLEGIEAQVLVDQKNLPSAIDAVSSSGSTEAEQGLAIADKLLGVDTAAQATVAVTEAATTTAASSQKKKNKAEKKKNHNRRHLRSARRYVVPASHPDEDN
jgi:hypothetical protein